MDHSLRVVLDGYSESTPNSHKTQKGHSGFDTHTHTKSKTPFWLCFFFCGLPRTIFLSHHNLMDHSLRVVLDGYSGSTPNSHKTQKGHSGFDKHKHTNFFNTQVRPCRDRDAVQQVQQAQSTAKWSL